MEITPHGMVLQMPAWSFRKLLGLFAAMQATAHGWLVQSKDDNGCSGCQAMHACGLGCLMSSQKG
jgi:radical SAM protein with 4Fe4S-binding SPASM domain